MRKRTFVFTAVLVLAVAGSLVLLELVRSSDTSKIWSAYTVPVKASNDSPSNSLSLIHEADTDIWEIFFSVFGLIYAIIVGLFIVEAHRRIRELSTAVQSELNALGDINDFLRYFEVDEQKLIAVRNVRTALTEYLKEVCNDMVPRQKNSAEYDESRRIHIADIIRTIGELESSEPLKSKNSFALEAIIHRVGELTTFRAQKTEVARRGFPILFYVLLLFMTAVTISGFILLDVESALLHNALVAVITGATTVLFLLVLDLDSPLTGFWNIRDELDRSITYMEKNLAVSVSESDPNSIGTQAAQ